MWSRLGAAGLEEDGRDAEPRNQQKQGVGHERGQALNGKSAARKKHGHGHILGLPVCREGVPPGIAHQAFGVSEPLPLEVLMLVQVPALTSFQALP